jgi:AhpD family alkylhydroperoxidase
MTMITPKPREELKELEPVFELVEAMMGFLPNSMLTMAHWPELVHGFAAMGGTILAGGELPAELKQLVAFVSSNSAGCRYCQAHTSHSAQRAGVPVEKIRAAFEYETSSLFTEPERAALRVAAHAGMTPNAVEPGHMETLRQHYSHKQCVEIVAVISLFGYLNRWNDTMATTLEASPLAFADSNLADRDWSVSKHA